MTLLNQVKSALLIFVALLSLSAHRNVATPSTVLLQMPGSNAKNLQLAVAAIETAPTARVKEYCSDYQIFVVQYDAASTNPESIVRSASNVNLSFWCEIKDPAGFTASERGCVPLTGNNNTQQ